MNLRVGIDSPAAGCNCSRLALRSIKGICRGALGPGGIMPRVEWLIKSLLYSIASLSCYAQLNLSLFRQRLLPPGCLDGGVGHGEEVDKSPKTWGQRQYECSWNTPRP